MNLAKDWSEHFGDAFWVWAPQTISRNLTGLYKEDFKYIDAYAGSRTHVEGDTLWLFTGHDAAVYSAKDYYKDNSIEVQVTNSQLRIGLHKTTTIRRDWVMIDNWKLEYLGN